MTARVRSAVSAAVLIFGLGFMVTPAGAQQHGADARPGRGEPGRHLTQDDRAALLYARLAAIRAGLRLTADQEKLWPPMEAAARERAQIQNEIRQRDQEAGAPANLIDGLRRHGQADAARGAADTRFADAAQPLWTSLSDEQKRRFPILARGVINAGWSEQGHGGENGPPQQRRGRAMGQERPGPRGDAPQRPDPLAPPPQR